MHQESGEWDAYEVWLPRGEVQAPTGSGPLYSREWHARETPWLKPEVGSKTTDPSGCY